MVVDTYRPRYEVWKSTCIRSALSFFEDYFDQNKTCLSRLSGEFVLFRNRQEKIAELYQSRGFFAYFFFRKKKV